MSFSYKNPISQVISSSPISVSLNNNTGTNFSMYNIGGYMEVFSISDLNFTIPSGSSGTILYSGNTIPINFSYNDPISAPNSLGLETDGISSGRRRLGMLVYVQENQTTYQYQIDNYETLFNDALNSGSLIDLGNGYQCLNNTPQGVTFINAWTGSSVESVSGVTRVNARWRIFGNTTNSGGGNFTGGTVTGATNFTAGLSANTISATTYQNVNAVTGGTYLNGIITLSGTGNVNGNQIIGFSALTATTLYSDNGSLSSNRVVTLGTNTLRFSNTSRPYALFITNAGLVGINNNSPSYALDVVGTTFSTQAIANNNFAFEASGGIFANQPNTGYNTAVFQQTNTNTSLSGSNYVGTVATYNASNLANTYSLYTCKHGTAQGSLTNVDNGVGVARFGSKLTAGGTSNSTTSGDYLVEVKTLGTFNTALYISGNTNVGIGTTSPSNKLHVSGLTDPVRFVGLQTSTNGNYVVVDSTGVLSYRTDLSASTITANTLTVNSNTIITGTTFLGNGTFTKTGFNNGDITLDNNGTDTPGVLFYYGNNENYGIDSWNGSFSVLSGQLLRFVNRLNESSGSTKVAIDTTGNMALLGFVSPGAWREGQVINDIMLSNTAVTISTTTIATSTSDTDFLTYTYQPISSTSYLVIHYHLADYRFDSGTGNDSYFSRIKVDSGEITYSRQSTVNGNRTGVLFPLTGRYTNENTSTKTIVVACRRDSADDSITISNTATSMWLRITEIAR